MSRHTTRRASSDWRLPAPDSYACFQERVRCLQALFLASVTGGGRTVSRNTHVKGADLSKHLIEFGCMGADLAPDDPKKLQALHDAAEVVGLWAEVEANKGIVHVQGVAPGE